MYIDTRKTRVRSKEVTWSPPQYSEVPRHNWTLDGGRRRTYGLLVLPYVVNYPFRQSSRTDLCSWSVSYSAEIGIFVVQQMYPLKMNITGFGCLLSKSGALGRLMIVSRRLLTRNALQSARVRLSTYRRTKSGSRSLCPKTMNSRGRTGTSSRKWWNWTQGTDQRQGSFCKMRGSKFKSAKGIGRWKDAGWMQSNMGLISNIQIFELL